MAKNIFLDPLNDRELMSSFGVEQENAPLTPQELVALSEQQAMQQPEPVKQEALVPAKTAKIIPKQQESDNIQNPDVRQALDRLPKDSESPQAAPLELPDTDTTGQKPETELERLERMLSESRSRDRMLKVGGAIGDALATIINARSQMGAKVPGVQVQQGAGLGKVADMFATAPEIQSDVAAKREAMLRQYAELARGQRAQSKIEAQKEIAQERNKALKEAALIGASRKGVKELTSYQEVMREEKQIQKQEKDLKALKEIETRKRTIEDNIERAKTLIDAKGTFELFGPSSEELNSIIDEISVDMAKLQDPESVARPNEVALVRKNLVPEGAMGKLGMSNETATALLDKFKSRVEERAKTAYQVRGIKAPTGKESVKPNQTQSKNDSLVKIKAPSGAIREVSQQNAEEYLKRPGYSKVD